MESLKNILEKNMHRHKLGASVISALVIKRVQYYFSNYLGAKSERFLKVSKFQDDFIFIHSKSSAYLQEFHYFKQELLSKLRKDFPEQNIIDFKII